jgi:hypothetical protein
MLVYRGLGHLHLNVCLIDKHFYECGSKKAPVARRCIHLIKRLISLHKGNNLLNKVIRNNLHEVKKGPTGERSWNLSFVFIFQFFLKQIS